MPVLWKNYFPIKFNLRKKKILETGCGMGNNLWMISEEGFSTFELIFQMK